MPHLSLPTRAGAVLAALVLAVSLVAAGALSTSASAQSARVHGCVAAHLKVTRGIRMGATGHRFTRFRIANTGTHACRLEGYPTFHFRNRAGKLIGFDSAPAGLPVKVVVIEPGHRTRTQVGTVDPAVVTAPGACRPRRAGSVDITLPHRPHVYNVALRLRVCTTRQERPTAYPVGF